MGRDFCRRRPRQLQVYSSSPAGRRLSRKDFARYTPRMLAIRQPIRVVAPAEVSMASFSSGPRPAARDASSITTMHRPHRPMAKKKVFWLLPMGLMSRRMNSHQHRATLAQISRTAS